MMSWLTRRRRRIDDLVRFAATSPIWICSLMHASMAGVLFTTDAANGGIATATLLEIFRCRWLVAAVLLAVSIAGLAAISTARRASTALFLLIPQQALMFVVATGAIEAILLSSYADGVLRPRSFIFNDQVGWIAWAIAHLVSLIYRTAVLIIPFETVTKT